MSGERIRLVDKQVGESSHDVVARVRREIRDAHPGGHRPKVGHAGTLDPFATGLLIVLVGRATRAQRWFMGQRKAYVTEARLGWTSTTGDPEGELTHTGVLPAWPPALPTGVLRQRPPAYSAIKIDGERAYAKARRGEEVDVPEREVTVHRFALASDAPAGGERPETATFEIECSSGTYVRSLIADLGDAYCTSLRRTAIGPFDVADAGQEIPLGDALARILPSRTLDDGRARDAVHGRAVADDGDEPELLLCDADGLIAIASRRRPTDPEVKPVVGFRGS